MLTRLDPPSLPAWLARHVPFTRYRMDVGGWRMHVMEQGSGRPVLLVHGNPTWGFLYRKVARRLLGQDLRLIMPDLIGLGFSDHPRDPSEHTLESHRRWLGNLVEALDLRDCILVVQDWGGAIGWLAFESAPQRLAGAVVLNTALGPPKIGFRPTLFHRMAQTPVVSDLLFRGLRFPQSALWLAQRDRRSMLGVAGRAYRYPLRRYRDNVAPLALARMVPTGMDHPSIAPLGRCEELVRGFKGPARVVWGTQDPILGRLLRHTSGMLPQALVERAHAGHFLQEEVPASIASAILGVAKELDEL